ncbi:hypothetical protein GQR58_024062 [Nymphon striatum]|nr:hypothetical protein GQR58_024062 [Nymphon striatum]
MAGKFEPLLDGHQLAEGDERQCPAQFHLLLFTVRVTSLHPVSLTHTLVQAGHIGRIPSASSRENELEVSKEDWDLIASTRFESFPVMILNTLTISMYMHMCAS